MSDENTQALKLAKDGTRRGVSRAGSKNRATQLLEQMQEQIQAKYGLQNFDPVVMLAMIGVEARRKGQQIENAVLALYAAHHLTHTIFSSRWSTSHCMISRKGWGSAPPEAACSFTAWCSQPR